MAGCSSPLFLGTQMRKVLSIFIDESGDFGAFDKEAPYYLVTMLFHDQENSIKEELARLDNSLLQKGFIQHHLHTGPLIRREEVYRDMDIDLRRHIFAIFMNFARHIEFTYKTFIIPKKEGDVASLGLIKNLSIEIKDFLSRKEELWARFDEIIVYYDNGQIQLTKILASAFSDSRVEFRMIKPAHYRLFQIADLITTLELTEIKCQNSKNSKSELLFFKSMRDFHKNFYKHILKKRED